MVTKLPSDSKRLDCPRCAAHRGGRIVAWRLRDSEEEIGEIEKPVAATPARGIETRGGAIMMEKVKQRIRVTEESFEETFRCEHCGYNWLLVTVSLRRQGLE